MVSAGDSVWNPVLSDFVPDLPAERCLDLSFHLRAGGTPEECV